MMIFSLTLTANQIQILRCYADFGPEKLKKDENGRLDLQNHPALGQFKHFVTGTKTLCNEGLLHFHNPGFSISEKGLLVLQLVEMDVRKFLENIEAPKAAKAEPGIDAQPAEGKRKRAAVA